MSDIRARLAGLTSERRAELLARLSQQATPVLAPRRRTGPVPASFAQRTLWFLDRLAPGQATYHTGMLLTMTGPLDVAALQRAFAEVVRRHEGLRTRFDDGPSQCVLPEVDASLPLSEVFDVKEFTRQPFDLTEGPLWRARLMRVAPEHHVLVLVVHHIVIDGWSLGVIMSDLAAVYRGESLDPAPLQYIDYSEWQREWLEGKNHDDLVEYWRERLAGSPITEFSPDRPRSVQLSYEGGRQERTFPAFTHLDAFAKAEHTTSFTVYLAAFLILVHRYTGMDDIVIGAPSANRSRLETERIVGFFANMLVLRTDLSGDPTVRELLARVRETVLGAFAHCELPFERLVDALRPKRDPSRSPFFQIGFTAAEETPEPEFPGLKVESTFVDPATSRFDLSWWVTARAAGLHVGVEYNSALFDPESVGQFIGHYANVLEGMLADPDRPISTVALLSAEERHEIVTRWNGPSLEIPPSSVPALFEKRVREAPSAVALVVGDIEVSYAELNRRANRIAGWLRAEGAEPGKLVALCLPRGVDLIASVLAVLKTGAAYVPIDPTFPAARRAVILEDADPVAVLEAIPDLQAFSEQDVDCPAGPGDVAYVMYTSGTTGRPKGVLIEHHSIVGFVQAAQQLFELSPADRILGYASATFDVFVGEVFNALLTGARLCLAQEEDRLSIPRLQRLLETAGVTVTDLPPAVMALLEPERLPALRIVFVGGEAFPGELVNRWNPGRRFFNGYGPTECTVTMVVHECPGEWTSSPPIGLPIANHAAHVVDRHLEPMPYGVPGELVIGGEGLTRGYLNAPDLTAEKIVADPFGSTSDGRLYRTGDLVKRQRDGSIVFLGRIDHQVKIRGMRIELGDIEAAIATHPGVDQVVAIAWSDERGEKHLVAYVTGDTVESAELREHLAELLPRYMLPSYWVVLETMPLTVSGKVDHRRLPAPSLTGTAQAVAPSTETERIVAQDLLAGLLRVERVGVTDDFFELGGNSLQAALLMSRITSTFGVEVSLADFYLSPTVGQLARHIDRLRASGEDDLLKEIEEMSEEEALRLLEIERQRS